ncbi:hypothetical protein ACH5RR_000411 [Cinchona calisaya]|uniref:Fe2OG dioxygenase domain-containing protein n=1 Tax=Cinchona calisaya TaxID=153742 RepID=A0ABD3B0L4_9GENT
MHNNNEVGANVHTDKGFITILHQTQVNALEVEARNGEWIDFSPAPLLVLAGDAYQNTPSKTPSDHERKQGKILHCPVFIQQRNGSCTGKADR